MVTGSCYHMDFGVQAIRVRASTTEIADFARNDSDLQRAELVWLLVGLSSLT